MLISLFFNFPQRHPSHQQGSEQGAGKWSILSYCSARSSHTPSPGRRQLPRSPALGCADTALEPLPLLGTVMEIKPSRLSCPIISPPGAKDSSYLLIAQWLLQLEFRRADPAGMCSAGRAPLTWLCPMSCCTPHLGQVSPAPHTWLCPTPGVSYLVQAPDNLLGLCPPRFPAGCPQSPSGIPPANHRWRAALSQEGLLSDSHLLS